MRPFPFEVVKYMGFKRELVEVETYSDRWGRDEDSMRRVCMGLIDAGVDIHRGLVRGKYRTLNMPTHVFDVIKMYYASDGYADMNLIEFVQRMANNE